jgi:hypothetical protein
LNSNQKTKTKTTLFLVEVEKNRKKYNISFRLKRAKEQKRGKSNTKAID